MKKLLLLALIIASCKKSATGKLPYYQFQNLSKTSIDSFNLSLVKFSDSLYDEVQKHNDLLESQKTDSPYNQKHF